MSITRNIGHILLAAYLILVGLIAVAGITIPPIVIGGLAIASGIFILIER